MNINYEYKLLIDDGSVKRPTVADAIIVNKNSGELRFKNNVTETSLWPGANYLDEDIHQTASTPTLSIYLSKPMQMVLHMMEQHGRSYTQTTPH